MTKVIKIRRRDIAHRLRQVLRDGREHRRELTLWEKAPGDTASLEASGAIRLTINDILPTVNNSLQLPPGMELEMGVTGGQVWPASIDDVEIEEEDEVLELTDQTLSFAKTMAAHPQRAAVTVEISNRAIDSAGFDLLAFVQRKFQLAVRKYLAAHIYSTANFDGLNGPFSGAHASHWVVPQGNLFDAIQAQMTLIEQQGFDISDAVIVIDSPMEVRLKYSPIRYGEGRMIIEDGLCAGYPYVVNNYFNTELDSNGRLVRKATDAIGIGVFKWFKVCQHGSATLRIDGKSEQVAKKNVTAVTLNTAWSFNDLTEHINGEQGGLQCFRTLIMRRGYLADCDHLLFRTSDGYLLRVGLNDFRMLLADKDGNILRQSDGDGMTVNLQRVRP